MSYTEDTNHEISMMEEFARDELERAYRRKETSMPGRIRDYQLEITEATRKEMEKREKRLAYELAKIEADGKRAVQHAEDVLAAEKIKHEEEIARLNRKAAKDRVAITTSLSSQHRIMINELQETCRGVTDDVIRLEREMLIDDENKDDLKVQLEKELFDEMHSQKRHNAEEKASREARFRQDVCELEEEVTEDAKEERAMANDQLAWKAASESNDQRLLIFQGSTLLRQMTQAADIMNSRIINAIITEIRALNDESGTFSGRVIGICYSAGNVENPTTRSAALTALTRFIEKIKAVANRIADLEQLLSRHELDGIEKIQELRDINIKIQEILTPVAHLDAALRYGEGVVGGEHKDYMTQFEKLAQELRHMINSMEPIEERRGVLNRSFLDQSSEQRKQRLKLEMRDVGEMQEEAVKDQLDGIVASESNDQMLMGARELTFMCLKNQAVDNTNRRMANEIIKEIRMTSDESRTFARRVIGICSSPALCNEPRMRIAALNALVRFTESTKCLIAEITNLELLLERLELDDVNKAQEIRNIKVNIHEFLTPVAHLETALRNGDNEMSDEKKECITQFQNLVKGLTHMIISMGPIKERSDVLNRLLNDQVQETMSTPIVSSKQLLVQHIEQHIEQRKQQLMTEKAKVDEDLAAQQERHRADIDARKANAIRISKEEVARVQQKRNEQKKEVAKLSLEIKAVFQKLKKDQETRGKEESVLLEKKRKELEELLEKKREQLKRNANKAEEIEKRRQTALEALEAESEAIQKAFEERLIAINKESYEKLREREDKSMKVAQRQSDEMMKAVACNSEKMMKLMMLIGQLQAALQLDQEFELFKLQCNALRRQHSSFVAEYNLIESELLSDHQRLVNREEVESDLRDLMESLRIFTTALADFNAAGSTKEQEFAKMIGDLTMITGGITTEFNAILSRMEKDDDEKKEGGYGILRGIIKVKELMAAMSPIMDEFKAIRANRLDAALADQLKALTMSASRPLDMTIEH